MRAARAEAELRSLQERYAEERAACDALKKMMGEAPLAELPPQGSAANRDWRSWLCAVKVPQPRNYLSLAVAWRLPRAEVLAFLLHHLASALFSPALQCSTSMPPVTAPCRVATLPAPPARPCCAAWTGQSSSMQRRCRSALRA